MEELESLMEELQTSIRKVVSSPPANYVQVHEWPGGYGNGSRQALGSAIFRENMIEIERMLSQLDELDRPLPTPVGISATSRSSSGPSFTLESLMHDLKEFQLEYEVPLSRGGGSGGGSSSGSDSSSRRVSEATSYSGLGAASSHAATPLDRHSQASISPSALSASNSASIAAAAPAAVSGPSKTVAKRGSLSGTRCAGCREHILGQMVHALGRVWHLEHFRCSGCQSELGRQTFYETSGRPFCEPCYQAEFSPKCAQCGGPILDRCVTALSKQWHPEHFFCRQCTAPFGETSGFHEREGWPYCVDCFNEAFSPKCRGCGLPITANYVTAMEYMWHPSCFVCKDCGRDLGGGGSFYEISGTPYCELHYHANRGTLCITCERPIASRCITAMGRKFHPECFKCAFCNNLLSRGTFMEKESKPYCNDCYTKLFHKK